MGQVDLVNLFEVYYEILFITKKYELPYHFKIDEGTYETAIEFVEGKSYHPPISNDWHTKPIIFCPDLLDYSHKIIIEFEEEIGEPKSGAKLAKKGHNREGDFDTKRDERRNKYYEYGKFTVLRIWESEKSWRKKLEIFLLSLEPTR